MIIHLLEHRLWSSLCHLDDVGFTVFAGVLHKDSAGAKMLKSRSSKRLHALQQDVTCDSDIKEAVAFITAHSKNKGLWGVVNNAGVNVVGDIETTPIDQINRCLSINLFGMIRVTQASGGDTRHISINHMSKFALESVSDSLRLEMRPCGVGVSIIEPGKFDAATTISDQEIVKIRRDEVDIQWERATEEVKSFYGKDYFNLFSLKDNRENSAESPDKVIEAVVDALLNGLG
uniref:Dehydrogenase/reductase SDR family member 11 n=1 Tax=Magallana gigas TaxID=29159 RepID=A0A8W8HT96_MAGGI